jgi:hypothetical protein
VRGGRVNGLEENNWLLQNKTFYKKRRCNSK